MKDSKKKDCKVGVVLINWNGGEYTIPCIESLLEGKIIPWKIVVIDNGSNDGSPELIFDKFPDIHLIRNKKNKGFTVGNNQGINYLLSEGADYIWVLNNDTLVDQNCLDKLLGAARLYPHMACFTGKIYYDKPSDKIWYAGGYRQQLHLSVKHRGEDEIDKGRYNEIEEVEFISGCCMFFPCLSLNNLGGFIDDYFVYSEDNEWCWRAIKSGHKLLYVPDAIIWHLVSATAKRNTSDGKRIDEPTAFSWFFMIRNNFWTIRYHCNPYPKKLLAIGVNIIIELKMIISNLVKKDFDRALSIWNGMYKGLLFTLPKNKGNYLSKK